MSVIKLIKRFKGNVLYEFENYLKNNYSNKKELAKILLLMDTFNDKDKEDFHSDNTAAVNNELININDIHLFNVGENAKSKNDFNNKKRENIISNIINNKIPVEYYGCLAWSNLKTQVHNFLKIICPDNINYESCNIKCDIKAGRGNSYDFNISFDNACLPVEWKFNATKISECPQWTSPHNPSQYMSNNFEEDYYNVCLPNICSILNTTIPDKNIFLKKIHNDKPECMTLIQAEFYKGTISKSQGTKDPYDKINTDKCKKLINTHINEFINNDTLQLNITKLNNYFKNKQKDKIYMLWKDGVIHIDKHTIEDYTIDTNSGVIKTHNQFIVKTFSGKQMKILLRWKNGVAYPAFQIS